MKSSIWLLILLVFACKKQNSDDIKSGDTLLSSDTAQIAKSIEPQKQIAKEFSNERFRQVTLEKVDEHKFRVQGQAQIFEASFNWVVEDGHNELKTGFSMTDAGAPEWGKFDFTIDVEKKDAYSTLILILFEVSAEDGSRKYELPIPLQ
ncbi:MAG: Gmad2 immunoglobulin-like domain-containing protein [Saprospiraceae bacterium]|nr:Gmad2 immunoglobulin-like domain-containing protein [Saprospiraceae bacterium]